MFTRFNPCSHDSHPAQRCPSAASRSRRETDVNTGTREVDFQAAQFVSFQKSILFSPLLPPLPLSSFPPFASPLSSLTQVGEESGTSRRRSGRLYTGAKYPLLYWRMGRRKNKKKKGVGQKGEGRMGKDLWKVVRKQNITRALSLFSI